MWLRDRSISGDVCIFGEKTTAFVARRRVRIDLRRNRSTLARIEESNDLILTKARAAAHCSPHPGGYQRVSYEA